MRAPSRVVQVFAAICTGSAKLSRAIGLPLVHVDASTDIPAATASLNARAHGAGVATRHPFVPVKFEDGWADWAQIDCDPGHPALSGVDGPQGVRACGGRLDVELPPGVSPAGYRRSLHATLRHLRIQEVTSRPDYMADRFEEVLTHLVKPRLTGNGLDEGFRGATLVEDLYVLDPTSPPAALFWPAVAARVALLGPIA